MPLPHVGRRWRQRRHDRSTLRWLTHLALPYALFYLADPAYGLTQVRYKPSDLEVAYMRDGLAPVLTM